MNVDNVHERLLTAAPEDVTALFADLDQLWPTPAFPAPEPEGDLLRLGVMLWQPVERADSPLAYEIVEPEGDLLRLGPMLWQPVERAGAARAYEIVGPKEFPASHWFEVNGAEGGTVLRHTVRGEAVGGFEPVWRDRIEPLHNAYMEAVLDRAQEALA